MRKKLSKLEASVSDAARRFASVEKRREAILKDSRDVISLCSRSIVALHSGDVREAAGQLKDAKARLDGLRKEAEDDLRRYLTPVETEFVEASCFLALVKGTVLPSMEDLDVSPSSYALGLLDMVGEAKRKVFDSVRAGKGEEAAKTFDAAEEVYSILRPLAVYDNIVPGIRRKLDVGRVLLEDIRGLLTEEAGRNRLLESLRKAQGSV
ncbi:MAG: RNA-binding protein [Nitrososphaerota archaeon]|nr:RNA-binding protein [Nitrososphaerota archaeon]MDG6939606.1 RNA-binding protein [Nitrososphaerota archaeon]